MGTATFSQSAMGATRSLTEVFVLLRNNCIQSRHIFADSVGGRSSGSDDRLTLIPLGDGDGDLGGAGVSRMPPEWVNVVDEFQYEMSRVRTRVKDLKDLQQRHVNRPNFNDDTSQEEKQIEASTMEITKMLTHCQRLVQLIQNSGGASRDSKLRRNVVVALIQMLQTLTSEFRSSQASYLNQLRHREDNYQQYFEVFSGFDDNNAKLLPSFDYDLIVDGGSGSSTTTTNVNEELTMKQLQTLQENTTFVKEREREILNITKSIVEVNQLFKDLAELVVDQGTVLDRIDYNLEQSTVKVKSALKSVKKAEQYQKKNRKMMAIVVLSVIIIFLLIILIAVKV